MRLSHVGSRDPHTIDDDPSDRARRKGDHFVFKRFGQTVDTGT
jgi:hypothetical protein